MAIAVAAITLALVWHSAKPKTRDIHVVFVLSHAEVAAGTTLLDHKRLISFNFTAKGAERTEHQQLQFALGEAPDVTQEFALSLAETELNIDISCEFALLPDSTPVRTRGRVAVDGNAKTAQTIDIDSCGPRSL